MTLIKIDNNDKKISFSNIAHKKKIKTILSKNKKIIVLLHASWCGNCKEIHKYWDKTIKEHNNKNKGKNIKIFEIEHSSFGDIEKDGLEPLSEIIKNTGHVPVLFYLDFKNDNEIHYHEERINDAKSLGQFLKTVQKS